MARAGTPYVAFADDDSWWAPGALAEAVALFDRHPRLAVLAARILVGAEQRPDPDTVASAIEFMLCLPSDTFVQNMIVNCRREPGWPR